MDDGARLTLLPLTGPWHLRHPRWNVATVRDALEVLDPEVVWTTALRPGYGADPAWRDTDELALPWTVAPWAAERGTPLVGVGEAGAEDAAALERYLAAYPSAAAALDGARAALRPLADLLPKALDLPRLVREVVPVVAAELDAVRAAFGDGPATGWRDRRAAAALARVDADARARGAEHGARLVELDRWPAVARALDDAGRPWRVPPEPPVGEAARRRALLDVAWRGEADDPAGLLALLREVPGSEARFLETQVLLAHGHAAEALEVLEAAAAGDFREPYLLPGLLLARLGQLRDLAGRRDRALQAYRGALALAWAPAAAREAARDGMRAPFVATGDPAADAPRDAGGGAP